MTETKPKKRVAKAKLPAKAKVTAPAIAAPEEEKAMGT